MKIRASVRKICEKCQLIRRWTNYGNLFQPET
jgi:ribosomal protein L36